MVESTSNLPHTLLAVCCDLEKCLENGACLRTEIFLGKKNTFKHAESEKFQLRKTRSFLQIAILPQLIS